MSFGFKELRKQLKDAAKAVTGSDAYKQAADVAGVVARGAGDAVHQAAVSARDSLAAAAGMKTLQNYEIDKVQVASAGPGLGWKIFPATSRRAPVIPGQTNRVSVWILDKRSIVGEHKEKGKTRGLELYVELVKRDIANLSKVKHPCFLQIIEPLEETRNQLVLVTEPILGSVHNVLSAFTDLPEAVPEKYKIGKLGEQEIKFGMLQLSEGLAFLGNEAGMVHRGISLETVLVSFNGSFKISGMGWALSLRDFDAASAPWKFDFADGGLLWWEKVQRPPLGALAPELVKADGRHLNEVAKLADAPTPAADVFSLAALMYHLIAGQPLLMVEDDTETYWHKVQTLGSLDFSAVPALFQATMKAMVSLYPSQRPAAITIAQAPFFTEDVLLRALKFLDSMLQRNNLEKAGFIKDLASFWERFDTRVLTNRVVPPLLGELRTDALSGVVVPLVIAIVKKQSKEDFLSTTLPALQPIMATAGGETMMHLLRGSEAMVAHMPRATVDECIVPLIMRAFDSGNASTQEEALKKSTLVTADMEFRLLKAEIVPRLHAMCLKTTSAGVRFNSMVALSKIVTRLDQDECDKIVQTVTKVVTVDKSSGTVMCVLGLAQAISKQWGVEMTAQKILPLLCPLTVTAQSPQNFEALLKVIREMLSLIESKKKPVGEATASSAPSGGVAAAADPYSSWSLSSATTANAKTIPIQPPTPGAPPADQDDMSWLRPTGSGQVVGGAAAAAPKPPGSAPMAPRPTAPAPMKAAPPRPAPVASQPMAASKPLALQPPPMSAARSASTPSVSPAFKNTAPPAQSSAMPSWQQPTSSGAATSWGQPQPPSGMMGAPTASAGMPGSSWQPAAASTPSSDPFAASSWAPPTSAAAPLPDPFAAPMANAPLSLAPPPSGMLPPPQQAVGSGMMGGGFGPPQQQAGGYSGMMGNGYSGVMGGGFGAPQQQQAGGYSGMTGSSGSGGMAGGGFGAPAAGDPFATLGPPRSGAPMRGPPPAQRPPQQPPAPSSNSLI
eukprot:jgi/Tetstr1/432369/TSEL_021766.t1